MVAHQNCELIIYNKKFYVVLKESKKESKKQLIRIIIFVFLSLIFLIIILIITIQPFKMNSNYDDVCGTPSSNINISSRIKRIINGEEANPHSFPWLVSIRILRGNHMSKHGL